MQKTFHHLFFAFVFVAIFSNTQIANARSIPLLTGPVVDEAGLLTQTQRDEITNTLIQFKQQTQKQVQLLIINSLQGDVLEEFSIRVVDQWKLGDKVRDDGVLFLISVQDRKMRIEVGQGLEGDLTDAQCGRIIAAVRPYFRSQDYFGGVTTGLNAIIQTLSGQAPNLPSAQNKEYSNKTQIAIFVILIAIILIINFIRKVFGFALHTATGGVLGSSWSSRSSSGSSWGSSGGGWSGGGGGFSGGGSSGGW